MREPRSLRRQLGQAVLAPVVLHPLVMAVALLTTVGCASTPPPAPPPAAARVSLGEMAAELGMSVHVDSRIGRIVLEDARRDRITAMSGTRTVTVRGKPIELAGPLDVADGTFWLEAEDALTVRGMWHGGASAAQPDVPPRPVRRGPDLIASLPPHPDLLPGGRSARPPADVGLGVASAAERAAWGVPLRRDWDYLVMHHSASSSGNAARFDVEHKERGWDGLGYHFVIGNGHGSGDGEVEVGFRWQQQREGAHAGNEVMNQHGIGICLVGDFTKRRPTNAQVRSLQRLSDFLSAYCSIPSPNIRYHRDVRDKDRGGTLCPGKYFPTSFRFHPLRGVSQGMAFAGGTR